MNKNNNFSGFIILSCLCLGISFPVNAADLPLERQESIHRRLRISRLSSKEEYKKLLEICLNHRTVTEDRNYLDTPYSHWREVNEHTKAEQSKGIHDPIFGIYSLSYTSPQASTSQMIGVISLLPDPHMTAGGYAECQMLIDPRYRNQKLGTLFLKKFNEEIINPKVGKQLKVSFLGKPLEGEFRGVKAYIHIDNIASHKVFTISGYNPVDLAFEPYREKGEPVAQITYNYPNRSTEALSQELKTLILQNSASSKNKIIEAAKIRQKEYNKLSDFRSKLQKFIGYYGES